MRVLYIICLFAFLSYHVSAQQGLEHIIVEKFYVSTEADKAVDGDGGELPVGSVTYRVFVDMHPDYIFQAAYGTPEHELKIATSTTFFNNEDRGGMHPTYTRAQAQTNTVMLDSWLSVGAGMRDHTAVLKSDDDGVNTIVNGDGVLQNADTRTGIPITEQDGVIAGTNESVTVVGFFDADLSLLDDANDGSVPSVISTHDGAWSALNGSAGPNIEDNIVLIGQFTTDGVFEFELNLQLRNEVTEAVENYVARDPRNTEILFTELIHIDSLDLGSATKDFSTLKNKITVYPNPTSGELNIILDQDVALGGENDHYTIRAIDGSSISSGKITGHNTTLELHQWSAGFYFLTLELESKYFHTEKIVLTK